MATSGKVVRAAAVVAIVVGLSGCQPPRWQSQLASPSAAGTDGANNGSFRPALSADGTKVVFWSYATDLGPTDTNGLEDIYVRDLITGDTELVSVNTTGTDSANDRSILPSFSPDGAKVLFVSSATDLVSPSPGRLTQLYLRDLATDTTTLISENVAGTTATDWGTFSPDGTRILFSSSSGLFERDLTTGVVTRLTDGGFAGYSPSGDAIAFYNEREVWLRDTTTGVVSPVSVGRPGTSDHGVLTFSHDGNRLAFTRDTTLSHVDIYVYDRTTGATTLATPAAVGAGGSNNFPTTVHGFHPSNADGLLFSSDASNLVANDSNRTSDVFIRDLAARTTTLVSLNAAGSASANRRSPLASWVGAGAKVAFVSQADDLGPKDTNGGTDIYLRDLAAGTSSLVSTNAAADDAGNAASGDYRPGGTALYMTYELSVSADGTRIAFGSEASNLGPTDSNGRHDIYVASPATAPSL